ncbi:hypothetical protein CL617_05640 [archaeon]|jgi:rRNA-processing protein FCF1|nr:hypothetical protein [archaeon]|tara:strand:- start:3948 stop:4304 length:357 start_codon:yes stop_codon:yes gene_type:complete
MYNIILDTSFVLTCIKFKIDIFREIERISNFNYEISIIDRSIGEFKRKKDGKLAVDLLMKKNVKVINASEDKIVDDLIVNLANNDKNVVVATQDIGLRSRLTENKIITIKQKSHLILI